MEKELKKIILTTVAYYDAMDFPLTSFEVWKYLTRLGGEESAQKIYSLEIIREALKDPQMNRYIDYRRGFYFLRGREKLVDERLKKQNISQDKIRRLRRYIKWLRMAPFVRSLAITGRLAMKQADYASDWDLLVICQSGRLFIGRSSITLLAQVLGVRRKGKKIADRICLNSFLTTDNLEINLKDAFSASEYFWARPIFGFDVFRKFQLENGWIQKYKPNFLPEMLPPMGIKEDNFLTKSIRWAGEKILNWDFLEKILKDWQLERIKNDPRTHKVGSVIWANEERLLFFPEPKSPKIYDAFQLALEKITKE